MSSTQVMFFGVALVLAFDTIASLLSRSVDISYGRFTVGWWISYALVGYFATKAAQDSRVQTAMLAGLLLGATDSILGWAVSWFIGPGRVNGLTTASWFGIAIFVTVTASIIAGLAGLFARIMSSGSRA